MSFVICNIRISFVIHVHAYIWSACARNLCKAVFWRDHWTHFQKPLPQGLPGWWIPTTSPIGRAHPRNPHPFIHVVYIYIQGHAYEDILPDGLNRLQSCLNWYIYIYTHMYRQSNTPTISQPLVNTTKYTHTNTYQYTHTHKPVQIHTNTYKSYKYIQNRTKNIQHIQIHTNTYKYIQIHTNTYKHIHAYTNIQTYMPTYLRTYIYTHVIVIIHVNVIQNQICQN